MNEIKTEQNKINRRTFLHKSGKVVLGLAATGFIAGTYSFKIERFWYQIREVRLKVKGLPEAFEGWKVVQFSDVHLGFHYGTNDLKPVIKMINDLNADIIFFTGDLVQVGYSEPQLAIPLLQELKAPRGGKWAVIGNHDFIPMGRVTKVLESGQFKVLINSHGFIEHEQQRLYIAGLDDMMYGKPNVDKAIQGLKKNDCIMLLAHEPDIADKSSKYPINAQFSGHSHGGQVRLPFYGPIIKQTLAKNYMDGLYHVGENQMPLYVNRGIGTTNVAVRFFCRPEITVFHLTSK